MKYIQKIFIISLFTCAILIAQDDPIVYVTKSGSKYHSAGCGYLRSSSIPIKLSEASKSYSPCSRCSPGVQNGNKIKSDAVGTDSKVSPESTPNPVPQSGKVVGQTPTGKTIYEGPRGGRYHYSKSGKKVYERKKR